MIRSAYLSIAWSVIMYFVIFNSLLICYTLIIN
ncbi:hypothetical protein CoNPh13_CDS0049 [Staphylococcus phage S-CoN_Ph13]|nr:hypothetical protein CoNPh13_CDS0049 [Staphylococcus phage S-CoN_Ph13]